MAPHGDESNFLSVILFSLAPIRFTESYVPHLRRMGYDITDVTCAGRAALATSMEQIFDRLKG
jgi:hypothetical protein